VFDSRNAVFVEVRVLRVGFVPFTGRGSARHLRQDREQDVSNYRTDEQQRDVDESRIIQAAARKVPVKAKAKRPDTVHAIELLTYALEVHDNRSAAHVKDYVRDAMVALGISKTELPG
jgi:hypothetical protein